MLPLARYLIQHPNKDELDGIIFEPEEHRFSNLLQNPLERDLNEVGQNNIIMRYGAKQNIPIYLTRHSQLSQDLEYIDNNCQLCDKDYLGIFSQNSANVVLDFVNQWRKRNGH